MEEEDPTDATFAEFATDIQMEHKTTALPFSRFACLWWLTSVRVRNSGFFPDGVQQFTFTNTATLITQTPCYTHDCIVCMAAGSHADEDEYPTLAIIIVTLVGYITRRGYQIDIKAIQSKLSICRCPCMSVSENIFSLREFYINLDAVSSRVNCS